MTLRSIAGIAGFCLAFVVTGLSQTIENPEKPKASDALRVIVPKEAMTITDESGEYFFKYPYGLKNGPDGSIVVMDNDQVLRFDKDGTFIRNYFKKGQGPGEVTQVDNSFVLEGGSFFIHSVNPPKMIWFDSNGMLGKEITLSDQYRWTRLQGFHDKDWIFEESEDLPSKEGAYISQFPHHLILWNELSGQWTPSISFDCTYFVAKDGGSTSTMLLTSLQTANLGKGLFAISHTDEYVVKVLDISSRKIIREFRRSYKRIPPPPLKPGQKPARFNVNGKNFEMPEKKFARDISSLQAVAGRVWVTTSTRDEKKGVLIDVFDIDGIYQDAFYLKLPEAARSRAGSLRFSPTGDAVFAVETTPDETIVIKKYALK